MYALNDELCKDVQCSSWRLRLKFLLTQRGLERYRSGKFYYFNNPSKSPAELDAGFDQIFVNSQPVRIMSESGCGGVFMPD
jgi:hypothetical protein